MPDGRHHNTEQPPHDRQTQVRQAAKKPPATATPAKATKPATGSPSERKLRRLAKEHPYRQGTALAKMAALVVDGMTVAELTAAQGRHEAEPVGLREQRCGVEVSGG